MTRTGRPLRFLGATLACWIALRVVILWPDAPTANSVIRAIVPGLAAEPVRRVAVRQVTRIIAPAARPAHKRSLAPPRRIRRRTDPAHDRRIALALAAMVRFGAPQIAPGPPGEMIAPPFARRIPPAQPSHSRSRWSADLWLVARSGSSRQAGFGRGQLGGAQAGARVAYTLDRDRRVALFARVDTPLAGRGREAAAGIDWRPTRLPIRLVVEARAPLDGGNATPAAGLVGGFGPVLRRGVRLEGYGQAGVVARRGGFADGAVRATRPLGRLAGIDFDLGAGAWGGAQRNAARLDLGPTLGASVPVGGHAIRVTLDWRERVAGAARPGSGPALTIGASF